MTVWLKQKNLKTKVMEEKILNYNGHRFKYDRFTSNPVISDFLEVVLFLHDQVVAKVMLTEKQLKLL